MLLEETFDILPKLYNKPFRELKLQADISSFTVNKGNTGQFLQALLKMPNNSKLTDFDNGELKTNKSKVNGMPEETMFITQISKDFDKLFFTDTSETNRLLTKIANLLYLPVVKEATDPNDWYFLPAHNINIAQNQDLFFQLKTDFNTIKEKVLYDLEHGDKFIHTSNGKYIQIRSKDAKRKNGEYNPIYSEKLGRYVSNKNHAFYFKKEFMIDIQNEVISSDIIF